MTSYVTVDAGFTFKLLVPNPQREPFKQLVRQWAREQSVICAPYLWLYELTSILTKMVYFGEIDEVDAHNSLELALTLGVQLIPPNTDQAQKAFAWTRRLQRVAAYDSFYLALAQSLECDLWTTDQRLVNAVRQPWVRLADKK
jgi:predicted nucleic acid-binding protein